MTVVFYILLLLTEHHGQVMFGGVPVPGATITVTQGEKKFSAVTDPQGAYSFPELADGPFTIQVEMLGFSTIKQEVNTPTAEFELKMLPIEEIHAEIVHNTPPEAPAAPVPAAAASPGAKPPATPPRPQTGFQRTEVNASSNGNGTPAAAANQTQQPPAQSSAFANLSQEDLNQRAADSLLINGSVNNGAASPFAQLAQFGNSRRGRPLYTGNASILVDNSRLDARPVSFTGQDTPRQSYNKFTGSFNIGGPLRIPHLIQNNAPTFFFGYQRLQNRNANTLPGRMPTAAERAGDFSQSLTPLGAPTQIIDPLTGLPFEGNIIPQNRISPQARALLNLYPLPNFASTAGYNYQIPLVDNTHQDNLQGRINKGINQKNQVAGNIDIQNVHGDNPNIFNFLDSTRTFGISGSFQWTNRPTQRFSATFRYQFSRQSTRLTPYFANRINVSDAAQISGNLQESPYFGPPSLAFSSGISGLSDAQFSFNRAQNHIFIYNSFWNHGRHNITFGADLRLYQFNVLSQQDPRGTFTFTGLTAYPNATPDQPPKPTPFMQDFAGFLLGVPDTTAIAFGNADKYFRQRFINGSFADDWRVGGSLTLNLGMRWEYESPSSELRGRLVNLNVARDFSSIAPVVGNGLVHTDAVGVQPRLSFAWRPIAASSLIVRGGYGIYRNTNVYQIIATQMAQQSPLSKSFSTDSPSNLANGFVAAPLKATNTFAIDPNFRVGFVQTWQLSIQRDLPAALQMTAMYLGTKGSRLPQEFLPNTFPSEQPIGPAGYVFLTSDGNSIRHAGQIQLRRRLRSGFTATTQYTYSKALDNAPLMAGGVVTANQGGTSIAQDWTNLKAERGPSNFDQRHQFSVQTQYTTGAGVRGGALLSGWRGALFKEWTLAGQLNVGSGLPLTPIYFAQVKGTGVTGNRRPDATGVSVYAAPAGVFLNSLAYSAPAAGHWGNAGRNSIVGPSQFSLNASLGRSFPWRDRYNIDLRLDANNVLNHVTFRNWNTTFGNAQFGLPSQAAQMRIVQTTLRLRF